MNNIFENVKKEAHQFTFEEHKAALEKICNKFGWEILGFLSRDFRGHHAAAKVKTSDRTMIIGVDVHPKSFDDNGFRWDKLLFPKFNFKREKHDLLIQTNEDVSLIAFAFSSWDCKEEDRDVAFPCGTFATIDLNSSSVKIPDEKVGLNKKVPSFDKENTFVVKYSDWKNRYQPAGFVSVKGSYNPETKKIAVYHDSGLEQMLADQLEAEVEAEFGGISFEVDPRPVIKIETKTVSWKEWYSKWASFGFKIINKDSTGVTFEMDSAKLAKKAKAEAVANAKAEAEVEDWCAGIEF